MGLCTSQMKEEVGLEAYRPLLLVVVLELEEEEARKRGSCCL